MTHSTLRRPLLRRAWFIHLITCVSASAAPPAVTESTKDAPVSPDEEVPPSPITQGFLLGGGLGGVIPGGEISDKVRFGDVVSSFMIGRLDGGYRFNQYFLLGAYTEGGTGIVNTGYLEVCDEEGVECNASLVRLGLQARAYYPTAARFQPWGGVGFGYEWFSFSADDEEYDESVVVQAKGAERLRLSLGLDIWAKQSQFASMQIGYSLGKYSHATYTDSIDGSSDLKGGSHHAVTISATYNLML